MRAWIFQRRAQLLTQGAEKASWYVGWYTPDGKQKCKSFGSGTRGHRDAEKYQRRIEGELAAGTYQNLTRRTWAEFRTQYEEKHLQGKRAGTRDNYAYGLNKFEELIKPVRMLSITTKTIADFVAARRNEAGRAPNSKVSPATINRELRTLRAALRKAYKWGYLARVPEFEFQKKQKKLPIYVPEVHFAAMYIHCRAATRPTLTNGVTSTQWWQALLIFAYLTGWRIGALLAVKWSDLNLEAGTVVSQAQDNKGDRDELIPLHPLIIEHLKPLKNLFAATVFPWDESRRNLWPEFHRIQKAADVKPAAKDWYGFHDLRRAFATYNADRMTPDALQQLMAHVDYSTTQQYINIARQLRPAVQDIFVPTLPPPSPDEKQA